MPSGETFSILPIRDLVKRYTGPDLVIVDPFARNCHIGTLTNDLNPATEAACHLDSVDFLDDLIREGITADVVLFDPPYSPRQISENYRAAGLTPVLETTQNARFCRENKNRLDVLLKIGGVAICCGWNTSGMGLSRDYALEEILMVCHGEGHNDTLVTVERKIARQDQFQFEGSGKNGNRGVAGEGSGDVGRNAEQFQHQMPDPRRR